MHVSVHWPAPLVHYDMMPLYLLIQPIKRWVPTLGIWGVGIGTAALFVSRGPFINQTIGADFLSALDICRYLISSAAHLFVMS